MNIADPFKQLVERRLWPIALLLVAALVAVPFLLAKDPEAPVLPTAVATGAGGPDVTESVVTLDDATRIDEARSVLGARKDPFRPAQLHPVPTVEDSLGESAAGTQATSDTSNAGSGTGTSTAPSSSSSSPSPSSGSSAPSPATTPSPTPVVAMRAVSVPRVSFDLKRSSKPVEFDTAYRLQSYPSAANPVALYLGLDESGKAVFALDEGVTIEGDAKCVPTGEDCDAILVGHEDTVFLTRGDKEYELEALIEETEAAATDVEKYWATEAKGGQDVLKEMGAAGYRYDKRTGVVSPIERKQRRTKSVSPAAPSAGGSRLVSAG